MRFVRFEYGEGSSWGILDADAVTPLAGDPTTGTVTTAGTAIPRADVRLIAPVMPSKIVCVGRNYRSHVGEMGWSPDLGPVLFLKPPSAVVGSGASIELPEESDLIEPEPELGVVIGRRARNVAASRALSHVFGYVLANDVSARDLMSADGQWTRAKGYDTFCPVGPWIETDLDPADQNIVMSVDGVEVTNESVRTMRLGIAEIIEMASAVFTLEPGDLILTGSPAGRAALRAGNVVRISMAALGVLENDVVALARTEPVGAGRHLRRASTEDPGGSAR
ncbi:fumarylacetoacetate hydrolase family protein [Microbacterium radiodurans]|uniref:DUF2437 domain-containing protein n=1 Tax=Microbacterium radiodurans TaxID=661398 RepID=A0A5J5IWA1_9MICO|nr:fumarylacetoacetate hydrolase family protein [Microbacterium radiodurans]KAA9089105.1 DUF2437 domain-containing protein [Microbacterium radiodurans]